MSKVEMEKLGKQSSVIRELFEYGKKRKQEIGEDKVFDFSIGNPSIPSPKIVNDTLIDLLQNTESTQLHGYTSAAGDMNVRKSIAEYVNKTFDVDERPELIYMTSGAAAALTISLKACIDEDDEVIIFSPYFPEYEVFIHNAKGKVIVVPPNEKTFEPDLTYFEKAINAKTSAVIINSPNNPTGVIYSEEIIIKISEILKEKEKEFKKDIYLISDEPYRELVYVDKKVPYVTKYYDNTLVCYSFSKSLSLPGERIGYILVSSKANNAKDVFTRICGAGRSLGFICANSLFQYMIPSVIGHTSDISQYKTNLDILSTSLIKDGYEVIKPEGAFYLFVKALEKDANKFSEKAKEFELLLVPSDSFGIEGYVRISYCVSKKQIIDSLPAFKKLYESYER